MTHEDTGHYAAKHPQGSEADPQIVELVKQKLVDNHISCAAAHDIAEKLSVAPALVGKNLDLTEARISKCQMGLFGYRPQKSIVKPAKHIAADLSDAIDNSLVNDRITCERCWEIAEQQGVRKIDVASACEAKQIKVKHCQLGAF
jgi:hypothetical protein